MALFICMHYKKNVFYSRELNGYNNVMIQKTVLSVTEAASKNFLTKNYKLL